MRTNKTVLHFFLIKNSFHKNFIVIRIQKYSSLEEESIIKNKKNRLEIPRQN